MNDGAISALGPPPPPPAAESRSTWAEPPRREVRGRLFRKYVALFLAVVSLALLANGLSEIWFSYQEHKDSLIRIQREQAEAAAEKIGQFVREIEGQIGWTTQLPWAGDTLEQRRFDALRLLRQVPAITEVAQLDASGREELLVSRLSMDVIGSHTDFYGDPKFTEAMAHKVYYGPVYFRRESEPYMTLAMAGTRRDTGVSVAEVNLKFIWDVVSQIRVGERGNAYVVDAGGRLIAHPDISLVLRNTDLSHLAQIRAASGAGGNSARPVQIAHDIQGRRVLTAQAQIDPLDWRVFVELPVDEAYAPLYTAIQRSGFLLLGGLALAFLAGLFLARRMVVPIQALHAGAARIGGGDLNRRITVRTGDELEALADQFNDMADRLRESYAGLERKVEERTRELSETLEQQTATGEILRVMSSSPTDVQPVFETIAQSAARLCQAHFCHVIRFDGERLNLAAAHALAPGGAEAIRRAFPMAPGQGSAAGRSIVSGAVEQISDVHADPDYALGSFARTMGVRSIVAVPMLRDGFPLGAISIARSEIGLFPDRQIELLQTFADQAVIAIENVRLFDEVQARTRELARSVEELETLREVGQAVSGTLDLDRVLATIVERAVELSGADAGAIYRYRKVDHQFRFGTSFGFDGAVAGQLRQIRVQEDETSAMRRAVRDREPVQLSDLGTTPCFPLRDLNYTAGFRSVLIVPLVGASRVVGVLVIQRKLPGEFPHETVRLMQTFASQSVLAIQNARLFREIEEKSRQLELVSQHKSQFLANMSHELRTPLNAILGFTELLVDGLYGELSDKQRGVLERVQANGRHLLGLINDVLDLSKIEAGQLELTLEDYAMSSIVRSIVSATEPLAAAKGIALSAQVADGLPLGLGDERRLTQVLLNLVGNAIKFTDAGKVEVRVCQDAGRFSLEVTDTGPGIAPADQARIFDEFHQVDNTSTRRKGGTGLGLAISRKIIELHGGEISVASELGKGSTFRVAVPIRVTWQVAE